MKGLILLLMVYLPLGSAALGPLFGTAFFFAKSRAHLGFKFLHTVRQDEHPIFYWSIILGQGAFGEFCLYYLKDIFQACGVTVKP